MLIMNHALGVKTTETALAAEKEVGDCYRHKRRWPEMAAKERMRLENKTTTHSFRKKTLIPNNIP
jgi:hypothetical protein